MTECFYCNEPIGADDQVWRRIIGWERKSEAPGRKGGSDIVLRERTGEMACHRCVFRLQHGLAPEQESLL